jgi:hypothetical protein
MLATGAHVRIDSSFTSASTEIYTFSKKMSHWMRQTLWSPASSPQNDLPQAYMFYYYITLSDSENHITEGKLNFQTMPLITSDVDNIYLKAPHN